MTHRNRGLKLRRVKTAAGSRTALRWPRALLVIASTSAVLCWCALTGSAGGMPPLGKDLDGGKRVNGTHYQRKDALRRRYPRLIRKLRGPLVELVDQRIRQGEKAAKVYAQARGLSVSGDRVVVLVVPAGKVAPKELARALTDQGAKIIRVGRRHIKARVPLPQLETLTTKIPTIEHIRFPAKPKPDNTVITEARGNDSWTNALNWHDHGFRGQGVKVAVIDLGFIGLAARKAADEIPASAIELNLSGSDMETYTGHGCGVAEIVYDMAPEAQLYLIRIDDESDLEAAKDYCISNGIHIVNHSVGWYGFNFFDGVAYSSMTPSPVTIVDDANANGILWVNSAGNDQQGHALIGWQDPDINDVLDWAASPQQVEVNELGYLAGGTAVTLWLTWNAWPTTDQDFDLELMKWNGNKWGPVPEASSTDT